jgi:hypothetical protein
MTPALLSGALGASILVSLTILAALVIAGTTLAVRRGGRREDPMDNQAALAVSRFTMPVSLIVPLVGDASFDLTSLLAIAYPEFEVIVVSEQMPRVRWESLKTEWRLEAKEFFYRQTLETAPVDKIYRSARDTRLLVVEKEAAGRADAVNCGVNLARYRFISVVDANVRFDVDGLLRAMAAPLNDPAGVVAASSHIEIMGEPLQRLASIRSLMDSRLVWQYLSGAVPPKNGVTVWRRDAVVETGGFSGTAIDADLDLMVRLQTSTHRAVRRPEIVGHMSPRSFEEQVHAASLRQLATLQLLRIACRGKFRAPLAYFLSVEFLWPILQAWIVAATATGAALGWYTWNDFFFALIALSLGNATMSAAALLLRGAAPNPPDETSLARLLLIAPFDFVVSGAAGAYARVAGIIELIKGTPARGAGR